MIERVKKYMSMIKFSHTIFAMPFALIGYFVAVEQSRFTFWELALVVLCIV